MAAPATDIDIDEAPVDWKERWEKGETCWHRDFVEPLLQVSIVTKYYTFDIIAIFVSETFPFDHYI